MEREDAKLSLLTSGYVTQENQQSREYFEEGLVPFEYKDKKSKIKNNESSFLVSKCGEQSCEELLILQN